MAEQQTAPQAFKTCSEVVRQHNRMLERLHHGAAIVLEFAEPIRQDQIGMFHRVHLNPDMLAIGEGQAWRPQIFQPWTIEELRKCPDCKAPMERPYQWGFRCVNRNCPIGGMVVEYGPKRGIIRCETFEDYLVDVEETPLGRVEYVNAVVLFLDRRYPDNVLLAIRNTCGTLCETLGWRML